MFFLGYVPYHAERHGHGVGSGEFQLVTPLQVCGSTCGLAIDFYYGKKYRVLFIVDDPSRQFTLSWAATCKAIRVSRKRQNMDLKSLVFTSLFVYLRFLNNAKIRFFV